MSVAASHADAILLHNIPMQSDNDIQTEIRMPERYIKYLQLVQTVQRQLVDLQLDPHEARMLEALALIWGTGAKILVNEAAAVVPEISTTTAHRRLKALRQKGLIELRLDSGDNRFKYVQPTPATKKYFETLSRCMEKAFRATAK